jgi:Ca2+-binding EF-hand superfamily protein
MKGRDKKKRAMSAGAWNQKIDKHFKEFDDTSEGHISTPR